MFWYGPKNFEILFIILKYQLYVLIDVFITTFDLCLNNSVKNLNNTVKFLSFDFTKLFSNKYKTILQY